MRLRHRKRELPCQDALNLIGAGPAGRRHGNLQTILICPQVNCTTISQIRRPSGVHG